MADKGVLVLAAGVALLLSLRKGEKQAGASPAPVTTFKTSFSSIDDLQAEYTRVSSLYTSGSIGEVEYRAWYEQTYLPEYQRLTAVLAPSSVTPTDLYSPRSGPFSSLAALEEEFTRVNNAVSNRTLTIISAEGWISNVYEAERTRLFALLGSAIEVKPLPGPFLSLAALSEEYDRLARVANDPTFHAWYENIYLSEYNRLVSVQTTLPFATTTSSSITATVAKAIAVEYVARKYNQQLSPGPALLWKGPPPGVVAADWIARWGDRTAWFVEMSILSPFTFGFPILLSPAPVTVLVIEPGTVQGDVGIALSHLFGPEQMVAAAQAQGRRSVSYPSFNPGMGQVKVSTAKASRGMLAVYAGR